MRDAFIIGAYSTQFKRWPEKSYRGLTREAYLGALEDAGLGNGQGAGDDIGMAWFSNCGMWIEKQGSIRGQVCFTPLVREGLFPERVPMINVERGCASAQMALHGAWNIRKGSGWRRSVCWSARPSTSRSGSVMSTIPKSPSRS